MASARYRRRSAAWQRDQLQLPSAGQAALAKAEATYRLGAYESLLVNAGSSYQELRGARAATDASRVALAVRFGIALPRPDRLDALIITLEQLTEAQLEQVFGLQDTTRDPLAAGPAPSLLAWRREHLVGAAVMVVRKLCASSSAKSMA